MQFKEVLINLMQQFQAKIKYFLQKIFLLHYPQLRNVCFNDFSGFLPMYICVYERKLF